MGKQRVRCPRDDRAARLPAMIHLLSYTAWIMAILSCHVSMVLPPTKSVTIRNFHNISLGSLSIPATRSPENPRCVSKSNRSPTEMITSSGFSRFDPDPRDRPDPTHGHAGPLSGTGWILDPDPVARGA